MGDVRMVSIFFLSTVMTGCAVEVAQHRDAVRPRSHSVTVDFAPLFSSATSRNNSVPLHPKPDKDLMRRVLLSPNLVFEASRTSLEEPKVSGAGAGGGELNLKDALGYAVRADFSSVLINALIEHGSIPIAPVVTRRWNDDWWCPTTKNCYSTWMERLMLLWQQHAGPDHATDKALGNRETTAPGASKESAPHEAMFPARQPLPDDLPTVAMAVRTLGVSVREMPVAVERSEEGNLVFRPTEPGSNEPSFCGQLSLKIPEVAFQAEIVSTRDGRIIARIDESKRETMNGNLRRTIVASAFKAVKKTGYTLLDNGKPVEESGYQYIKEYEEVDSSCENAQRAYRELISEFDKKHDSAALVQGLVNTTLSRLY